MNYKTKPQHGFRDPLTKHGTIQSHIKKRSFFVPLLSLVALFNASKPFLEQVGQGKPIEVSDMIVPSIFLCLTILLFISVYNVPKFTLTGRHVIIRTLFNKRTISLKDIDQMKRKFLIKVYKMGQFHRFITVIGETIDIPRKTFTNEEAIVDALKAWVPKSPRVRIIEYN